MYVYAAPQIVIVLMLTFKDHFHTVVISRFGFEVIGVEIPLGVAQA